MRKLEVYKSGVFAGLLVEENRQRYVWTYDRDFLRSDNFALSVTLPKREEPYVSDSLFPFFANMLPEGVNRKVICQLNRIDENDYFGLLMFFSEKDIIGDVMVKRVDDE